MWPKLLPATVLLLMGLIVGYLLGTRLGGDSLKPHSALEIDGSSPASSSSLSNLEGENKSGLPGSIDTKLKDAFVTALGLKSNWQRNRDLFDLVGRLSALELESTIEDSLRWSTEDKRNLLPILLSRWAETEPAEASEVALRLYAGEGRYAALETTLQTWTKSDPKTVTQWVASLPKGDRREDAIRFLIPALAKSDPQAAIAFLKAEPRSSSTYLNWRQLFSEYAEQNPGEAVQQALTMPAEVRGDAVRAAANRWARQDPVAATVWASKLADPAARSSATENCYSVWAANDPEAATQALSWITDEKTKVSTIASMVDALSLVLNSPAAAKLFNLLPTGPARDKALKGLTEQWGYADPVAAFKFVSSLPPEDLAGGALVNILGPWAKYDRQAAIEKIAQLPSGDLQKKAAGAVAGQWAKEDPNAAWQWALTLPEDGSRIGGAASVIQKIGHEYLEKASGWIEALPPGATKDFASCSFALRILPSDPAGAADRAAFIPDASLRHSVLQEALPKWLQKDRENALRWIKENPAVSPQLRQQLLKGN